MIAGSQPSAADARYSHPVLEDLCPRCGAALLDVGRPCPVCGPDATAPWPDDGISRGIYLRPRRVALVTMATFGLVIVACGAGLWLGSTDAAPDPDTLRAVVGAADVVPVAPRGRVLFAERLGESMELESYRTQFTRGDTIAWRAEFVEPPPTLELTVVIEWYSIRERMRLSQATVTIRDAELKMVVSDEVPLSDLVPTSGLWAVSYYAGDMLLAEGIFELLPPAR